MEKPQFTKVNEDFDIEPDAKRALLDDFLLVLGAEQVLYNLHRRECSDGHLNKDCIPLGHSTIPQAGQLLRTEVTTTA